MYTAIANARMLPLLRSHVTHYKHKVQPRGWTNDARTLFMTCYSSITLSSLLSDSSNISGISLVSVTNWPQSRTPYDSLSVWRADPKYHRTAVMWEQTPTTLAPARQTVPRLYVVLIVLNPKHTVLQMNVYSGIVLSITRHSPYENVCHCHHLRAPECSWMVTSTDMYHMLSHVIVRRQNVGIPTSHFRKQCAKMQPYDLGCLGLYIVFLPVGTPGG